jgi:hypothetical protein
MVLACIVYCITFSSTGKGSVQGQGPGGLLTACTPAKPRGVLMQAAAAAAHAMAHTSIPAADSLCRLCMSRCCCCCVLVQPSNVLVMGEGPEAGKVKVADFGLARFFQVSPAYMSCSWSPCVLMTSMLPWIHMAVIACNILVHGDTHAFAIAVAKLACNGQGDSRGTAGD